MTFPQLGPLISVFETPKLVTDYSVVFVPGVKACVGPYFKIVAPGSKITE